MAYTQVRVLGTRVEYSCHYCGNNEDLRPYGPGGSFICYPCATATPEREAETARAFYVQLEAAAAISPIVVLNIDEGGPNPFIIDEEENND